MANDTRNRAPTANTAPSPVCVGPLEFGTQAALALSDIKWQTKLITELKPRAKLPSPVYVGPLEFCTQATLAP